MQLFGWQYVGTIAADDVYALNGVAQFLKEAEGIGICTSFEGILPKVSTYHLLERRGKVDGNRCTSANK